MAELNSNALTSIENFKDYINYSDDDKDPIFERLINSASDFLARYWNRTLPATTYTLERYDGGGEKLFLRNFPVTAITQVSQGELGIIRIKYTSTTAYNAYVSVSTTGVALNVDGTPVAEKTFALNATMQAMATALNAESGWEASVISSLYNGYPSARLFKKLNRFALNAYTYLEMPDQPLDDYDVDYDRGIIYLPSGFNKGFQNIYVSYAAGFASDSIPSSAEQICIELVKYKYDGIDKDTGLSSEKIGNVYAYTLRDLKDALPPELLAEANQFKSRV